MFHFRCRKAQKIIAASLYEPISEPESRFLGRHLATCSACREDAETLQRFVARLPQTEVVFSGDLLPLLRAQIQQGAREVRTPLLGRPVYTVLATTAFAIVIAGIILRVSTVQRLEKTPVPATAQNEMSDQASPIVAAAAQLVAEHNYAQAEKLLEQELAKAQGETRGQILQNLADLQFEHLHDFSKAEQAYRELRENHPDLWRAKLTNVERLNLLAETRDQQYKPLRDFYVALSRTEDRFSAMEKLLARYPNTLLANLILDHMREEVGALDGRGALEIAAMEKIREKCTDAVALAQVNLHLGELYWRELKNPECARIFYHEASKAPNVQLAGAAREALLAIDANGAVPTLFSQP